MFLGDLFGWPNRKSFKGLPFTIVNQHCTNERSDICGVDTSKGLDTIKGLDIIKMLDSAEELHTI